MRKAFVGGLLLCLMAPLAVPLARAQDGAVVATGELFVRRTIFCLDGQEFDNSDPSACDDERTTVLSDFVEIEFALDGSGRVTGSWELIAEFDPAYNAFCRHQSGGSLTGTYDPETKTITGDQLEEGSLRTWGAENEECTNETQEVVALGAWDATFDGTAVEGVIWIDDSGTHEEAGGITFYAPAVVTGDIGELEDGDAGPGVSDEELDEYFEQRLEDEEDGSLYYDYADDDDEGGGVPIAAVAGGAAVLALGGVGAARLARARRRRAPKVERTSDDPAPHDPCEMQRMTVRATTSRAQGVQASLEALRMVDRQLESAWNDTRESGFWTAAWDVASGAGGVVGGTATAAMRTAIEASLPRLAADVLLHDSTSVIAAMVKSFGESTARDFVIWWNTNKAPSLGETAMGVGDDALKEQSKSWFKEFWMAKHPGADAAFQGAVVDPVADAIGNLSTLVKVGDTTADATLALADIRNQQLDVGMRISALEDKLRATLDELELAQHALALCEKPAGAAAP